MSRKVGGGETDVNQMPRTKVKCLKSPFLGAQIGVLGGSDMVWRVPEA